MKTPIFVLLLLCLPVVCIAAPSKPSVSDTYSTGQTVSISGSGFGTKSPAKPYLWAPFDAGSLNPSSLGTVTSWDIVGNMTYTSNEGVGGTGGAKATDNSGNWTLAINSRGFNWNDYNQQIYIFRKKKLNFDPGSINWKVWRMWPSAGGQPNVYAATNNGCAYTEGVMVSCKYFSGSTFKGTTNAWDSEEIIVKGNSSSGAADGILRLNTDGVSAGNVTQMKYKDGAGTMTSNYVVHFVKADATLGTNDRVWVDDVYVDTTWARVMIGNASTYSSCTQLEPQIPTAWGANSISVSFNQGAFANGSTVYLYVIDANDDVSPASDPITIAGTGSNITCYQDADNDLYGHGASETVTTCSSGYYIASHFTALTGDCNDNNANIKPGATEICGDGIDQDCSGADLACAAGGSLLRNAGGTLWRLPNGTILTTGD